ncbi:uncharacterized protein [Littorina saxatilis]|uniref:uncharacterized protein isoform X2 n=1 Tax=Littorina saxatilis TaxID=31220 RepID=UPI0038B51560
MAEGKKPRCVLRLSPVAVLLTCILLAYLPSSHGSRKQCSVKSDGTLTMFNQETATVAAPCKYRLADFTCGDYQVKVTGGSAVKEDGSYSPDTMWVKVVNTATAETVKLRTSLKRIEEYEAEGVDNVWSIRQGTTEFLDFAGYDGSAYLGKYSVFEVRFGGEYDEVSNVLCYAENFSSPGVPVTLCGDGSTSNAILAAKTAQYGEGTTVSDEQFVRFVMLTDTTVTQSKTCVEAADELQGCAKKVEAAKACDNIFGVGRVVSCITNVFTDKPLGYYYRDCVKAVCLDEDAPAVPSCSGELSTQEP